MLVDDFHLKSSHLGPLSLSKSHLITSSEYLGTDHTHHLWHAELHLTP
jgi:hypothetical protein